MTPRPSLPLRSRLAREHAALRRALIARHALRAFAGGAVAVTLALLAGLAWPGGPAWGEVRRTALVLGAATAIGVALARWRRERSRFDPWLEALERQFPALRSWLRNAVDLEARVDPHTSRELAEAVRAETARRLDGVALAAVHPRVRPRAPLLAVAAAAAVTLAAALLAPRPTLRAWATLWNPALAAPPVTLAVEPGSVTLAPGATLAVRARVRGTAEAPRLLGDGPSPPAQLEAVENGARRWRFDLPPITRARDYAVRVRAARSPNYRIALAGEPRPVSFSFEYRSPGYARLPVQTGRSTSGDVAALRGSVAQVEVTFDRDLEALTARLPGGGAAPWHAITPRRWRGSVPVNGDGEWSLRAEAASGAGTYRWRVSALPDAPPVLTVNQPRGDQDLPSGSAIPYDVEAQDDLGLTDLRLEWRKTADQPWREVPLSTFAGEPRDARVADRWDAGVLGLLPGESGSFRFVVRDNDRVSGRASATSPEFRVRFPSMAELYQNLDHRQDAAQEALQRAAEQAHELQRTLDQLQRQQPRGNDAADPQFARREEMRKALERQQELSRALDQTAEDTRQSMADAAERQAFRQELLDKLHQMSDLMRQIQSPELRDAIKRMQEALDKMDRSAMERSLSQLREQNKNLLEQLDRSLALLKQMRDEEKLDALAHRADELKAQQDALNREHASLAKPDAPKRDGRTPQQQRADLAQRQRDAEQRSAELAKDAREATHEIENPDAKQDLQQAADQLEQQAAAEQEQAAQASESNQSQQAQQQGERASESLSHASQLMNRSSSSAQAQRQARQLAAVRRSAQDLLSLGRDAGANTEQQSADSGQQADRQSDLAEGVARVADSLAALGRETPVLSPRTQEQIGRAMDGLRNSAREMAQGNRARGQQAGRDAQSALSAAVQSLRATESSMCDKPGSKPGQSKSPGAGERMGMLSRQQGEFNERSSQLMERLTRTGRLSSGEQSELRRLADDQARIRGELEDIQRDDESKRQLLGRLDQAQKDMKQVEEELRSGNPPGDELEERETHILSRLLDAQRSINRRDFDPQREAHRGEDILRPSPAPLPAALLREDDRLRLDLMKVDADRYPAQYRALIERYLQKLNRSPK